ncbi:hypothetical protein [Caldicellulosiruptor morganii]|uniref:Uncharacterized protein n=1 Tax=Caldicellulosiruptor morganii TaxID=1387555 RepID=A0ABY7BM76_9FIRM|nr:hypothetical protein [Caldicellulosiruptor morganii]WAM33919.1 hypothetical protein OTK00_000060 [Caldicellulosiruptor morganii]
MYSNLMMEVIKEAKKRHSLKCLKAEPLSKAASNLNSQYLVQKSSCQFCLSRVHFPRKNGGKAITYNCQNMAQNYNTACQNPRGYGYVL